MRAAPPANERGRAGAVGVANNVDGLVREDGLSIVLDADFDGTDCGREVSASVDCILQQRKYSLKR